MNPNTQKVMDAMHADLYSVVQQVLIQPKIGLKDSKLLRSMQVVVEQRRDNIVIEVLLDDYVNYLEHGRKPMQGKQPPIDKLRNWALDKGIPTDNDTLFAIGHSIWLHGQQARPIMDLIQQQIDKQIDEVWMDKIIDSVTSPLQQYFN